MPRINGKLPEGANDGLTKFDPYFTGDPDTTHVVIVALEPAQIITKVGTGEQQASLRIRAIERILPSDAALVEKVFRRSRTARRGVTETLDIDVEDEVTEIFRDAAIDYDTGELADAHEEVVARLEEMSASGAHLLDEKGQSMSAEDAANHLEAVVKGTTKKGKSHD